MRFYFPYLLSISIISGACNSNRQKERANSEQKETDSSFFFQSKNYDEREVADYVYLLPKPIGWVNDYSDVFTDTQIKFLDSLCRYYEKKTTVEIAVVTIPSFMTSEKNLTEFTISLLDGWGVGKVNIYNGIVFAFAPKYRMICIRYGREIVKYITEQQTSEIIASIMVPLCTQDSCFEGMKHGIDSFMAKLKKNGLKEIQ